MNINAEMKSEYNIFNERIGVFFSGCIVNKN